MSVLNPNNSSGRPHRLRVALVSFAMGFLLVVPRGTAQAPSPTAENIPSDPSTAYDQAIDVPPNPQATTKYDAPDIPKGWLSWSKYDGEYVSYKVSIIPILDYDAFWQDSASIAQVGEQHDQWDLRSARFSIGGQIKTPVPLQYLLSTEYKGFDRPPGAKGWGSVDVMLAAPLGKKKYGTVSVGKIKETFCYEMVGDSANLPQLERLLNPFFTSRNVGLKYSNTFLHQNMNVSGGWFNDWWSKGNPFTGSSNHFSGRITGVPIYRNDGADYLHLGFAARHIGATYGTLQFNARPESNVTDPYINTGKFAASASEQYSLEALANHGPFSALGEFIEATTNAPTVGNPHFYGYYVTGSWVLTGEHRPYDRTVGYARRIIPRHSYGAWELVGRVGRVDLTDKAIQGGTMNAYSMNISWWANRRTRVSAGYGRYDVNDLGIVGTTAQFHARLQWVY
jgi:phosphate-selective porin OprO/OprP